VEGFVSLGLNDDIAAGAFVPEVPHKSAGLAFLLSLLVPGVGQFYCGKTGRGGITMGFWLLGLLLCLAGPAQNAKGIGILLVLVLWTFSFLDAYFTAIEINRGQDGQVDVQNPRVAVTLNLLTAGFGYFYLGERVKGILVFVATQIVRFGIPQQTGYAGGVVALGLMVLQMLMGADAYRIARMQLKEALGPPRRAARTYS
jgi:TM2 domain-containing membrane protein YozV